MAHLKTEDLENVKDPEARRIFMDHLFKDSDWNSKYSHIACQIDLIMHYLPNMDKADFKRGIKTLRKLKDLMLPGSIK